MAPPPRFATGGQRSKEPAPIYTPSRYGNPLLSHIRLKSVNRNPGRGRGWGLAGRRVSGAGVGRLRGRAHERGVPEGAGPWRPGRRANRRRRGRARPRGRGVGGPGSSVEREGARAVYIYWTCLGRRGDVKRSCSKLFSSRSKNFDYLPPPPRPPPTAPAGPPRAGLRTARRAPTGQRRPSSVSLAPRNRAC